MMWTGEEEKEEEPLTALEHQERLIEVIRKRNLLTSEQQQKAMNEAIDRIVKRDPFLRHLLARSSRLADERSRSKDPPEKALGEEELRPLDAGAGHGEPGLEDAPQLATQVPDLDWEGARDKIQDMVDRAIESKAESLQQANQTRVTKDEDIVPGLFSEILELFLHRIPKDEPDRIKLAGVGAWSAVTGNNVRRMKRLMKRSREYINKRLSRLEQLLPQAPNDDE